jgi:hypothetical protein
LPSGITSATGGTITDVGNDKVHTFTSSGTFTPTGSGTVIIQVVAGGGGGGYEHGGGGGGGGVVYNASKAVINGTGYTVTIGTGGAGATSAGAKGANGNNSVFGDITATGGGGGGTSASGYQPGSNGGCGGGGGNIGASPSGGVGSQGYDGGDGYGSSEQGGGGGGGGGGEAGFNSSSTLAGEGGDGYQSSINGSSTYYAGGGGGGGRGTNGAAIPGGQGGGGTGYMSSGTTYNGTNGTANTGGGGGGGSAWAGHGGNGGSGIVIVRYTPDTTYTLQSYSEATIKTQGSYALKVVASTEALNKTLTKTFSTNHNLTGVKNLRLDAYASRTGGQWKLGLHDTGGTTTEITPTIATANTWQTINFDLSAVIDANKDAIDTLTLTITNADSSNTIYIDDIEIAQAIDVFGIIT